MEKHFIQADQLLKDSYNLAWKIFESGFKPDYIIGVWRGGAPVGIAVQEFLDFLDIPSDHIAIRTSYYSGINTRKDEVQVFGLNYVIRKLKSEDSLLIVDDVYDTGITLNNFKDIQGAMFFVLFSKVSPTWWNSIHISEKSEWIVFPWENALNLQNDRNDYIKKRGLN